MFDFEKLLITHCSPTFAGIKPSNLLTISKKQCSNINSLITLYNNILNNKNIYISVINEEKDFYLLLVYNKNFLWDLLNIKNYKNLLISYGYCFKDLNYLLNTLKLRFTKCNFPHEIGAFLGYPYTDIICFINNKGKNYKAIGAWKVYSSLSYSLFIFEKYSKCKNLFYNMILSGMSFKDIIYII